jgi:cytoskeletal protein CcmA (bactofilin family)
MTVEKKTIRTDIPGHHTLMNGSLSYAGSPQEEARRLIVGRDITLNGDIACCDCLIVEGTVHAQGFQARRLDILEVGFFAGSAEVQDVVIAGRFEGKLTVNGRLTVKSTGRIYGEIEYGVLEAEAGAKLEGQMSALSAVPVQETVPAIEARDHNDNIETLYNGTDETEGEGSAETTQERPRVFRRAIGF